MQVSPLLDASLPTAVREESGVGAAARSPEELQYIKIGKHLSHAPGNVKFGGAINE